ncbi:MAG: helix-turn-helix domain-containing protein [bacterium]|nr:helix-turn-helix domain-containing protein [bacterium]
MIERTLLHWRELPDLSLREAGAILGIAPGTVRAMVDRDELEHRTRAGKIFVTVESVRRVVGESPESQENPSAPRVRLSSADRTAMRALRGGG